MHLSDAALSKAAACPTKWLYNSARRLGRPIGRTARDALWWRLLYAIVSDVRAPLSDAERAADLLLPLDPESGRVRLNLGKSGMLALSVDLPRFHDSAAVALAAAIHLTPHRKRGRPRRAVAQAHESPETTPSAPADVGPWGETLRRTLSSSNQAEGPRAVRRLLGDPTMLLARPVIVEHTPGAVGGAVGAAPAGIWVVNIVCDFADPHATQLALLLNELGARPRGVAVRAGFRLDAGIVRAAGALALEIAPAAVDICDALPGVGRHAAVLDIADTLVIENQSFRALSAERLRWARRAAKRKAADSPRT